MGLPLAHPNLSIKCDRDLRSLNHLVVNSASTQQPDAALAGKGLSTIAPVTSLSSLRPCGPSGRQLCKWNGSGLPGVSSGGLKIVWQADASKS